MANFGSQNFSDLSTISENNILPTPMENVPLEDLTCANNDLIVKETEMEKVREALNRQTLIQYRQYAMEKYPKEYIKHEELVAELQNQHFKNYWTNVHLEMIKHQNDQIEMRKAILTTQNEELDDSSKASSILDLIRSVIMPANLWTRKNIVEFKANILTHHKANCIKIQSLSTATIRIPTHKDGRSIVWEFATDYYDIGFGLLFEWDLNPSENVVVTISESSDDENPDGENIEDEDISRRSSKSDKVGIEPDKNSIQTDSSSNKAFLLPTDELITTYRRECHMEVYCGSHEHPGTGYYILKFDNSYSVWRSKWLYYNVFHTK